MRERMSLSICHKLMSLLLFVFLQEHALAIKQSYIVYLGSHSFGSNPSLLDSEFVTNSHYNLLGSYVGSTEKAKEAIFYSYNRYINGFAAILEEDEAAKVAKNPNVVSMFLNKRYELHTTRSWNFLGLERDSGFANDSLWKKSLGEDIIIGNLDTGVWPESKSFSDEGYGPIPKKWRGICDVTKENPDKFYCNRKLIGAKYFYKGFRAHLGEAANVNFNSARDTNGHGTHTLSTAGGNFVAGANVFGHGNGTASGGSPKARVASYKVCWNGCFDADVLAGFEAAISDGVDVLSVSVGGSYSEEFFKDSISIGSFHAIANNIIVVASGGNTGPSFSSIINVEPWILTVAASTIDRDFTNSVVLGDKKTIKGASLSPSELPPNKLYPLISGANAKLDGVDDMIALFCDDKSLDPKKSKGKILVCNRSGKDIINKDGVASSVGAIGVILINAGFSTNDLLVDAQAIPSSNVDLEDGSYILNYINQTKFPMAYITKAMTQLGIKSAPYIASFSSRGPNTLDPSILKPDITAPGVNIIAAYTGGEFLTMSGTSMSCPHVSGIAGLVKSVHPDWSPAAIKSAIMTTATTENNIGEPILDSSLENATSFAYGSGYIQPNKAVDPGLVYDLNIIDYLNYLCGRGYNDTQLKAFYGKPYNCPKNFSLANFNYPSITIPDFKIGQSLSVTRTVTNVGFPSKYTVKIQAPQEFLVTVEPSILSFKDKGEKKEFKVTFTLKPESKYNSDYVFGKLIWTNGKNSVGTPITINYPH